MIAANTHPTPLDFRYRIRWYILGKYSSVVFSTNRNTDDSLTEECLLDSAEVLVGSMIENAELQMCSDQDILATSNKIKLLNEFECEMTANNEYIPEDMFEEDCLTYILGYTAHKFKSKY